MPSKSATSSGAPKVRAMQIIDELEPPQALLVRRCHQLTPGFDGDLDKIPLHIRTVVLR